MDLTIKGRLPLRYLQTEKHSVCLFCTLSIVGLSVIYLSNSSVFLTYAQNHTTQTLFSNITEINDKFGITEIYPTKENGREWYLNMNNPLNDSLLSITFDPNITRQTDGSWRISKTDSEFSNPQIRMNVDTPSGKEPWRDVEMTGYIKIVSINSLSSATNSSTDSTQDNLHTGSPPADESEIEDIAWYARGGKRNEEVPCEGTAYFGGLHPDGTVSGRNQSGGLEVILKTDSNIKS